MKKLVLCNFFSKLSRVNISKKKKNINTLVVNISLHPLRSPLVKILETGIKFLITFCSRQNFFHDVNWFKKKYIKGFVKEQVFCTYLVQK